MSDLIILIQLQVGYIFWEILLSAKEQSDPTAHYTLNLMHPQHRALLRMLLRLPADSDHHLVAAYWVAVSP